MRAHGIVFNGEDVEMGVVAGRRRCPRCEVCGRAVRVRGVGTVGVWCAACLGGALPFVGIVGEGHYEGIQGGVMR